MLESGLDPDVKTYNMVFTKAPSCIVPADSDVVRPRRVRFLDYEIELGLVLRREITAPTVVTDADLHEFAASSARRSARPTAPPNTGSSATTTPSVPRTRISASTCT